MPLNPYKQTKINHYNAPFPAINPCAAARETTGISGYAHTSHSVWTNPVCKDKEYICHFPKCRLNFSEKKTSASVSSDATRRMCFVMLYSQPSGRAQYYLSAAMALSSATVKSQPFCTAGMWQHSRGECTSFSVGP